LRPYLHYLLTWWGLLILAALDTSVIFTLPIALDVVVVAMSALHRNLFWLVPIVATAGALAGAATSMKVGEFAGEKGLSRLVPAKIFNRIKRHVSGRRYLALVAAPLMPPPFPFTAVIIAAGALGVGRTRLLSAIGIGLAIRFTIESVLALVYGRRIIGWLNSDAVHYVAIAMIVVVIVGGVVSVVRLVLTSRRGARE
jgi:membrane protein YqaA with SNARE-associated domain